MVRLPEFFTLRGILLRAALTATGLTVMFAACVLTNLATGNFHEVVRGEFYRSAQIETGDISEYKNKYGIKTVINLRGENENDTWYQTEVAEAAANSVQLINFKMSAKHELPEERAHELLQIMANAPKPILIHCRSGADRSGLAAALYLAGVKDANETTSELQLSLLYGHLPFSYSKFYAMDRTFEKLRPSLFAAP